MMSGAGLPEQKKNLLKPLKKYLDKLIFLFWIVATAGGGNCQLPIAIFAITRRPVSCV
jgi:hypothetical protein